MPSTFDTARDEILGAFKTAWDAGAAAAAGYVPEVFYDGMGKASDPDPTVAWARTTIRHTGGRQSTLSQSAGRRHFEKTGIVTISIFAPLVVAKGLDVGEQLAKVAKGAFEGKATASGVWFRNVRVMEVGLDRSWYMINVLSDFRYDEFA